MTIILHLSGGAANADPELSLGGAKSSVLANSLTLFGSVSTAEFAAGTVLYRMVYAAADSVMNELSVWIATETPSAATTVALGWAAAGINETETALANETTAPLGVTFSSPMLEGAAISGGDFTAGQSRGLWIRYTIDAAATAVKERFGISYASSSGIPENLAVPIISGEAIVGETFTATTGTWSLAPTSYAYQWQASDDGVSGWANISGKTDYIGAIWNATDSKWDVTGQIRGF